MSLNAVAAAAKAGRGSEVEQLCGITQAVGYLTDSATRDVILIGRVDPSLPPLHLDDLVVALRNVSLGYAKTRGRVRYYAPPGCSIDPDPNVLRDLGLTGARLTAPDSATTPDAVMEDWKAIGRRPQNVRVLGVPFDSRFAKVMVDADYYMKRLTNGSVMLDIPGFQSLSELTSQVAREDMRTGREPQLPAHSLNRFWFSPGETTYDEDGGVITLKTCRVRLLTEEEFLTEHGRVSGFGRPSPLAANYAKGFTDHYDEIATARPIYHELEALFRLVAITRLMSESKASCAGLSYLVKSHRMKTVPVSRQVLGLTTIKQITETRETDKGKAMVGMVLRSCGGVSMDVRPKRVRPATRVARTTPSRKAAAPATQVKRPAPKLKKAVLSARKSPSAISWDFPLDK